jgi:hypothetical protein
MNAEDNLELIGGYGVPYDPFPALNRLPASRKDAIAELWENLYHQGDVGIASYAAVPTLVEAGELSLVGAIEVARRYERNPDLPAILAHEYSAALRKALLATPGNAEQFQGYYIIHASVHEQYQLANALHLFSVEETLGEYG